VPCFKDGVAQGERFPKVLRALDNERSLTRKPGMSDSGGGRGCWLLAARSPEDCRRFSTPELRVCALQEFDSRLQHDRLIANLPLLGHASSGLLQADVPRTSLTVGSPKSEGLSVA